MVQVDANKLKAIMPLLNRGMVGSTSMEPTPGNSVLHVRTTAESLLLRRAGLAIRLGGLETPEGGSEPVDCRVIDIQKVVKALPKGQVVAISEDEGELRFAWGRRVVGIKTVATPLAELPLEDPGREICRFERGALREGIARVQPFVGGRDVVRESLRSAAFVRNEDVESLKLVATDSYRMIVHTLPADINVGFATESTEGRRMVVSSKDLEVLKRLLARSSEEAIVLTYTMYSPDEEDEDKVSFSGYFDPAQVGEGGEWVLHVKLIDPERYIDYRQILPTREGMLAYRVPRHELADGLRAAMALIGSGHGEHTVLLAIGTEDAEIGTDTSAGTFREQMTAQGPRRPRRQNPEHQVEPIPFCAYINANFLFDAVVASLDSQATFWADPGRQFDSSGHVVRPFWIDEDVVMMPMRPSTMRGPGRVGIR